MNKVWMPLDFFFLEEKPKSIKEKPEPRAGKFFPLREIHICGHIPSRFSHRFEFLLKKKNFPALGSEVLSVKWIHVQGK